MAKDEQQKAREEILAAIKKAFKPTYSKNRDVDEVIYNRKMIALWLHIYNLLYGMDAPHKFGWCRDSTSYNKGGLWLIGWMPSMTIPFCITLYPGWKEDFDYKAFNEFSKKDLQPFIDVCELYEIGHPNDFLKLYPPIVPQYKARFNQVTAQRTLLKDVKPVPVVVTDEDDDNDPQILEVDFSRKKI